ncbi:MAG: PepSY-like domain-containing protein [Phycisphaerae bacterium]|nr:PepSY-like domain-containing protein [Phycisphaerae bacterium]
MKSNKSKMLVILFVLCAAVGLTAYAGKQQRKNDNEGKEGGHQDNNVQLPQAVLDAVNEICPDGVIEDSECETEGIKVFEVEVESDTAEMELTITPDGNLIEKETEIDTDKLPQAVKDAIAALGTVDEIEEAKQETEYYVIKLEKLQTPAIAYEVELEIDGKDMVIKFDADGNILEK